MDLSFYKNKRVLVTGHTGFKGTWLSKILINAGANVCGYSLNPPTKPNVFELSNIEKDMISIIGDIRDYESLKKVFDEFRPELVFHLAAQPIVKDSYENPKYTFETNVMGTVNILECIRLSSTVKSFLNVTTDKVYENNENKEHAFVEEDRLNGFDPYSNSKSCSELVTDSYKKSFFSGRDCSISTARAGNVIGGGDFANDRIIPDCIRALERGEVLVVRNPKSIRPYQHVLEPLYIYLDIVKKQYENNIVSGSYNIGPDITDCIETEALVSIFEKLCKNKFTFEVRQNNKVHEATYLKLDNSKVKRVFDWVPKWNISRAVAEVMVWTEAYFEDKKTIPTVMDKQIKDFFNAENR